MLQDLWNFFIFKKKKKKRITRLKNVWDQTLNNVHPSSLHWTYMLLHVVKLNIFYKGLQIKL